MSTEYLKKFYAFPRTLRDIPTQFHNIFTEKLSCILCNMSLDSHIQEHMCTLRPKDKDIIINKYL